MTLVNKRYIANFVLTFSIVSLFSFLSCEDSGAHKRREESEEIIVPTSVGCNSIINGRLSGRIVVAMAILRDTAFFYMKQPSYLNRVRKCWYDSLGNVQETERDFPDSELISIKKNASAFFLNLDNLKTGEEVDYIDPKLLANISSESEIDSLKGKKVKFHEGYLFLGWYNDELPYQHILYMNKYTKKIDTLRWNESTQQGRFIDFYIHKLDSPAIPVMIYICQNVIRYSYYLRIVPLTPNCFVNELK